MPRQAWRVTGLWKNALPGGDTILRANVQLKAIMDAVAGAQAAGMSSVDVEIWPSREQKDRYPTHSMRFVEPYQGGQRRETPRMEPTEDLEAFPF